MKNRINNMKKVSNGGFSMIELIIVISIMLAVVTVVFTSMSLVVRARAKTAATDIESLISRSKVNALSGRRNRVEIYYDSNEKCYFIKLYDITGIKDADGKYSEYETEAYEEQRVGSQLLNISFLDENGDTLIDLKNGAKVYIGFKTGTGKLDFAKDNADVSLINGNKELVFNINHGATYKMTVFANTGAVETVLV